MAHNLTPLIESHRLAHQHLDAGRAEMITRGQLLLEARAAGVTLAELARELSGTGWTMNEAAVRKAQANAARQQG